MYDKHCTCNKKTLRLHLHSLQRDSGANNSDCTFRIPDVALLSVPAKKVMVQVEKFHVQQQFADVEQTLVLMCPTLTQPYSYDSIIKGPTQVIALQGNPDREAITASATTTNDATDTAAQTGTVSNTNNLIAGSTIMTYDKLDPVEISNLSVTNRELTLKLAQIAGTSSATYAPVNRIWNAVLTFTIYY